MLTKGTKGMYSVAIAMVVAGSVCYHICNRSVDSRIAASVNLLVTYGLAFAIMVSFVAIEHQMRGRVAQSMRFTNWATLGLAVGVVLVELGYLLAYRAGGHLSAAPIVATTVSLVLLIPVGVGVFGEPLPPKKIVGIVLALTGTMLINSR